MPSDVTCRHATPEDLPALVDLWWEMQSSHPAYEPEYYAAKDEQTCREMAGNHIGRLVGEPTCRIYLALVGDEPIGMVIAHHRSRAPIYLVEREVAIENAVVTEAWRRWGVLRRLMEQVEHEAAAVGIASMVLTVHQANAAVEAYEALGFRPSTAQLVKSIPSDARQQAKTTANDPKAS